LEKGRWLRKSTQRRSLDAGGHGPRGKMQSPSVKWHWGVNGLQPNRRPVHLPVWSSSAVPTPENDLAKGGQGKKIKLSPENLRQRKKWDGRLLRTRTTPAEQRRKSLQDDGVVKKGWGGSPRREDNKRQEVRQLCRRTKKKKSLTPPRGGSK